MKRRIQSYKVTLECFLSTTNLHGAVRASGRTPRMPGAGGMVAHAICNISDSSPELLDTVLSLS